MKKLLLFVLVMLGGVVNVSADWLGAGAINVNGTWYRGDDDGGNSWAGNFFTGKYLGAFTSLELGGQVQYWDNNEERDGTAYMYYKFDSNAYSDAKVDLAKWKYDPNNTYFQSGGNPMVASAIDISGLSDGAHTITVKFSFNGKETADFTASFFKGYDFSSATITGIDATYEWTGSAIKPSPTVTYSATPLTLSTDYTVSYSEGCTDAGNYSVTITGAGRYTGSQVINYTINPGYYVVGVGGGAWTINPNYRLSKFDANQYSISDLVMYNTNTIKVVSSINGSDIQYYYPNGTGNDYTVSGDNSYTIYFRPDGKGGEGWHHNVFYVTPTTSVTVPLAPTGYGTYYNSVCGVTLPAGAEAYIMADGAPTYTKIADGNDGSSNTVPADVAMLLKGTTSVALTLSTSITGSVGSNLLKGSDVSATTTGGSTYYKLTYGSEPGHEDIFGWYWGEDEGAAFTSPAHKAWLALPASARAFVDLPGDETTGIKSMNNGQFDNGAVYDLQGRRVAQPTKGLYIVNGKKVIK